MVATISAAPPSLTGTARGRDGFDPRNPAAPIPRGHSSGALPARRTRAALLAAAFALGATGLAHAESAAPAREAVAAAPARPGLGPDPRCAGSEPAFLNGGPLARTAARLARGDKLRVLVIGSSTTAGVGASSSGTAYPSVFEAKFEKKLERRLPGTDVVLTVAGVSGETIAPTRARLETRLAEGVAGGQPFDVVVWQVGTNDGAAAPAEGDEKLFRRELRRGVVAARAHGADVVLIDPQFYPGIADGPRYERFVTQVHDAAFSRGASVVARYRVMKGWAEEANGAAKLEGMLAADRFHMNNLGHACTADMLVEGIAALTAEAAEQLRTELSEAPAAPPAPAASAPASAPSEPAREPSAAGDLRAAVARPAAR